MDDHTLGNDNALVSSGRRAGAAGVCGQGVAQRDLAGSATPPIRARHCRAKIGDATDPATSPVSGLGVATSSLSPRHHV